MSAPSMAAKKGPETPALMALKTSTGKAQEGASQAESAQKARGARISLIRLHRATSASMAGEGCRRALRSRRRKLKNSRAMRK